jgi:hypothetical protein
MPPVTATPCNVQMMNFKHERRKFKVFANNERRLIWRVTALWKERPILLLFEDSPEMSENCHGGQLDTLLEQRHQ